MQGLHPLNSVYKKGNGGGGHTTSKAMEGGRLGSFWSKAQPSTKYVRKGGILNFILNFENIANVRWVREGGRIEIGELKHTPRKR